MLCSGTKMAGLSRSLHSGRPSKVEKSWVAAAGGKAMSTQLRLGRALLSTWLAKMASEKAAKRG